MRNLIASLLLVLGLAACVAAATIVHPVLGLAVGGGALIALGVLTFDREPTT